MYLKAIGLAALAAIVALVLGGVPFAGAEEEAAPEYIAAKNPATLDAFGPTGGHEYYIRVTNEKGANIDIKCSTRTANLGTATTFPVTSIQTTVGFANCELNKEKAESVVNGCEYKFNLVGGSEPATATLDILCPVTKTIVFQTGGGACQVRIPEQKGLKHVLYSNNAGATPPDVTETFSITGLEYKITQGCPEQNKDELKNNGIYTDGLTRQATNGGSFVAFEVK